MAKTIDSMEDVEIPKPSVEVIKKWKRNDVTKFLNTRKESLDLDDEDIEKITNQKVSGQAFLDLTLDELRSIGLPLGPAKAIARLIETLKGEEQGN